MRRFLPLVLLASASAASGQANEQRWFSPVAGSTTQRCGEALASDGDITLVVFDPERDELIPAPASEYALLEKFIQSEECLRERRGTILHRGSCRNPWQSGLDLRASKSFSVGGGDRAEITVDLFNLPNLLNSDWGIARSSVPFFTEELPLLHLVGFDVAHDRGIYELSLPSPEGFGNWQAQLSMRYAF